MALLEHELPDPGHGGRGVGGAPLAAQLQERFFGPLGLDHTIYSRRCSPAPAHAYRFLGTDPKLPAIDLSDGTSVVPFTSVVTAAGGRLDRHDGDDLVHWAQALYGGDAISGPCVPGDGRRHPSDIALQPRIAYGLGVQPSPVDGHPALGHSGRLPGLAGGHPLAARRSRWPSPS